MMKKVMYIVVLCLVLTFAFVVAANAAEITLSDPEVNNGIIKISGKIDSGANQEVTILCVPKDKALEEISEDDIYYIDQITSNDGSATNFSIEFPLKDGAPNGEYKVYVGGTDVSTPVSTIVAVGGEQPVIDVMLGDVDGDKQVTASDIGCIKSYILNQLPNGFPAENGEKAADVDGDNQITASDIGNIKSYILNQLPNGFPAANK